MSWNQYVSTQLIATGAVYQAAILGKADTQVYAEEGGFALKQYQAPVTLDDGSEQVQDIDEAANLLGCITSGNFRPLQGIRLNGTKYQLIRELEGPTIFLKCPTGGACLAVTETLIIIGIYHNEHNKGHHPSACNKAVEDLAVPNLPQNTYGAVSTNGWALLGSNDAKKVEP